MLYKDVINFEEHRKDLFREAERARLARKACSGEPHRSHIDWKGLFSHLKMQFFQMEKQLARPKAIRNLPRVVRNPN